MWPMIFESNCDLSQDDFLAVMPCVRILRITLWRDFLIIPMVPPSLAGGQLLMVGQCRRIRELVPMAMAPSQGWNHAVMSWANPCVMSSVIILWLILTTPSIMKGLLLVELFCVINPLCGEAAWSAASPHKVWMMQESSTPHRGPIIWRAQRQLHSAYIIDGRQLVK